MIRHAFRMKIPPENAAEYAKRHDEIWPELVETLKGAGISDYSIFLDETSGDLFALMHVEDMSRLDELVQLPVMQKWWAAGSDIMDYDGPRPRVNPLREVFFLK